MEKLSTIIITLNEEQNIKECLESVKWADEIIIVDAYSSDNTVKICKNAGKAGQKLKIFERKWDGYSKQKNFGINKSKHNWILNIDADERITSKLKDEILDKLSKNNNNQGYKIPRKNFYFHKWIKWGGNYPDYQLRLFNKKHGKVQITPVHEGVSVKGKISKLKNPMLHYTYNTLNDYFQRFIKYTDLEKDILISKNAKINFFTMKYHIIILPFKKFITRFIFKLGFLDGFAGFMVIKLNNFTKIISFYKYYLWYKKNKKKKE